jgi:hypothetical protein
MNPWFSSFLVSSNPDKNHKLGKSDGLRYIYITYAGATGMMLQWEYLNRLFYRKVSFLTGPHCQFSDVGQGMKKTYLYLWYPLFQAQQNIRII